MEDNKALIGLHEIKNTTDIKCTLEAGAHLKVKPYVGLVLAKLNDGIYFIMADFFERFSYDGYISGDGCVELVFSYDCEYGNKNYGLNFKIVLRGIDDVRIFGEVQKKTFHATLLTDEAYLKTLRTEKGETRS